MALGFLDSVSPLVKLISQLQGQRGANKAITQANVPTQAETDSNALYRALLDPNSPLMAHLTEQAKTDNLSGFQSQINEMQLADRRSASMGRAPTFFNPERADEAVSYLTSRGIPQMNALAGQQAQNRIVQAAGGISGFAPAQQGRQKIQMQQGVSNATSNSMIPDQIMKILQQFGGGQQLPSVYRG